MADGFFAIGRPLRKAASCGRKVVATGAAICCVSDSAQWRYARCPSLPAEPLGGEGGGIDRLVYTFEVSPPLLQEGEKREARGV